MSLHKKRFRYKLISTLRNPFVFILLCGILVTIYLFDVIEWNLNPFRLKPLPKRNENSTFLIHTTGCRIPFLDPYDKSIRKYIWKVKPFQCSPKNKGALINSNLSSIYVELNQLWNYNIRNRSDLDCCYKPFWRMNPTGHKSDHNYRFGPGCVRFEESVQIEHEFVKVICKTNGTIIYTDFHAFVPVKHNISSVDSEKLNILILGLDGLSRLNFQRQMPKTWNYLRKELNGIELNGYNKVGDNSFPNLIPFLTGLSEEELKRNCWYTTRTRFDKCPFVWKDYAKTGYATVFGEDSAWMGMLHYLKPGFRNQPTDYYWNTFNYVSEQQIGHMKTYNAELCVGTRAVYKVLLDYVEKVVFSFGFRNRSYFSFFWGTSLSHDNLNYPALGDETYLNFFKRLKTSRNWNRTVLIVLSDHGIRWGEIRTTYQGLLEERLPFLSISLPDSFRSAHPVEVSNLKRNVHRLTTPFDLHETLQHLLKMQGLKTGHTISNRGISLFRSVPENRTCSYAGIAPHWCTCQISAPVQRNNSRVAKAAVSIVQHLNTLLTNERKCAWLHLDRIIDARLSTSDNYLNDNSTVNDYTILVRTTPGGALFEGTVRCVNCDSGQFAITGTISRLNLYKEQSACIANFFLKLYCYCIVK